MDIQTSIQDSPNPTENFADILEFSVAATLPANPEDSPETRARKLAAARRQFAAFHPGDEAEAQAAAIMLGAMDSLARAARPGVGNETVGRLRGNALTAARFYTSTLDKIRKRNNQATDSTASRARTVETATPPQDQNRTGFPKIELFHPRDRRGKPIPGWRYDLLSMKQRRAAYDVNNRAAWAEAAAEEDAAIAEQAKLDAKSPPTEEELGRILPLCLQPSVAERAEVQGSGAAGGG